MRHVVILAFDAVQILDVTGPAAVFGAAADAAPGSYRVSVASPAGEAVASSCGVTIATAPIAAIDPASVDLLLVAGGEGAGLRALAKDGAARDWAHRVAAQAERHGSVCSGAFALAAWGLADGRRVATHWAGAAALARRFPQVAVDPDALYIEDGRLWTSAGITTGIDMALAIVERDHGPALATTIARRLVLHARRAGRQSQFSSLLEAQGAAAAGGYSALQSWIEANLASRLDVAALAAQAGQSPRSFHRRFLAATGRTPAAFVETLRLERARSLIDAGAPLKRIAPDCGFATPDALGKAFHRRYGVTPSAYRGALRG